MRAPVAGTFDSMFGRLVVASDRAIAFALHRLERLAERKYDSAPLCKRPLASRAEYLALWNRAKAERHPEADAWEAGCGAAIEPEWFHGLALLTQVTKKRSEICYQHGRLLYATLVRYARDRVGQHLNIVETGTARGFSAVCLAKALADSGASGKIATFDVLPHDVPIYWNCVRDADGRRTRAELLAAYGELLDRYVVFHRGDTRQALRRIAFPRVHFAFFDSVHTYDHVIAEFDSIRTRQRPGDLLFFDDYGSAYPGVVKAADEICRRHGYASSPITAGGRRGYLVAEKQ
jgi:predicted O-methyltransferase YrrM